MSLAKRLLMKLAIYAICSIMETLAMLVVHKFLKNFSYLT